MTRKFTGDTLVLATHNKGKVVEFRDLFGDKIKTLMSAADLNLPEPEETGTTFLENATLKAVTGAKGSNLPCLADDSGLAVTGLDGAPGIYSARWAGPNKDFKMAMEKVNMLLGGNPDRSAAFVAVLVLAWPDGHIEHVEGRVEGDLIWPIRGEGGFGFDPMFVPKGDTRTFGEMSLSEKHAYSHRAKALAELIKKVF